MAIGNPLRLLITAGPTREPIDEVRFISNRSSGQMGLALAEAAHGAGHDVTLLLGPDIAPPRAANGLRVHRFGSTADLEALLAEHFPHCDVLVMAAAVADYRPAQREAGKRARGERWTIELEPTPDLVAAIARKKRADQKIVAFALESPQTLTERATEKLRRKGADAIVANPLVTMESAQIEPTWITVAGQCEAPGVMSKAAFAQWLLSRLGEL
ncbi:MAG: phosphopantothenoylcysteine decarboxylase [Phycisphaeraceae bacterium]